jgi:hypothetical protein
MDVHTATKESEEFQMNPIETLSRWKLGLPALGPSLPRFRPFGRRNGVTRHLENIERLTRRLDPLKKARDHAVTGEPNMRTDEPSSFDTGTRPAFQRELDLLQEETERQIQKLDLRIKRLPPLPSIEDAPIMATADDGQESVLRSWRAPLVDSKRAELAAGRSLTAFRRTNPEVQFRVAQLHNLLITVPGIVAVSGIEMVLNYELLLRTGGHTPSEIVTLVVLASLFNLLFGLGAGFVGIRNLGHIAQRRKVAGAAALALFSILIVGLAFFMANYRNAIDTVLNDPQASTNATLRLQRMALAKAGIRQTMRNDPLAFLGDLNAVLIFLLGIVFGGVAALEGYYLLDEPYPGYGTATRMNQHARVTHDRMVKRFQNEFAAVLKRATAPLDAALLRGQQRLSAIKACLDAAGRTIERYEKAATTVEHTLFKITMTYRDEYRIVRGNQGPPNWEDDIPKLNRELSFDLGNLIGIEEKATADYRALEDQILQLKSRLALGQASRIARMKEYLAAIDQDAAREEALALADLAGIRTPPPPDMDGDEPKQRKLRPAEEHPPDGSAA